MARVFTREAFYDLVWSKPLTQLANEFSLSDVALHKICKKHDIPHPPLGWWAKQAAGKPVKPVPLPPAVTGTVPRITIASADLSPQSAALARVREQARILASTADDDLAAPPHPLIDRTLAKLRQAKPPETGLVALDAAGLIPCQVSVASIDRLAVILPRIVQAASLQGLVLTAGDGPAQFTSEAESVRFSITELVRREKHVLTDAERARQEAWQKRAAQSRSWNDVLPHRPHVPDWDYHLTGLLSFELEHVSVREGASPRRSFRDAKVQRLETMASDIAVGLAVLAAAKTAQRLQHEAEQRRLEEERQRRERAARLAHIEERRTAELEALLAEREALDQLRRLLATLPVEGPGEPTPRLAAFLSWAKTRLEAGEERLSPRAIEARLTAGRLFGDDDDHCYVPARWY